MKEINRGRGGGCCCFCDDNDNGYADDDCNGNDDNNDWLLIASPLWGRGGRGRRINKASIQPQSCWGVQAGGGDLRAATARCSRDCWGLPPPPLPPRAARAGEGDDHICCRQSLGWMVMAMAIVTVWGEKGLDKRKERENWKMGLFLLIVFIFDGGKEDCFMLSYFVSFFWLTLFNAGWLIL